MRLLLLTVTAVLASTVARAADEPFARGIDPVVSKVAATTGSLLAVEGAQFAPARSYRLELALDLGKGLLGLGLGDEALDDLIAWRLDAHLLGSFSLSSWAEVGVDLPITAWQRDGFASLGQGTGFETVTPASWGAGDLRLIGKFRLLPEGSAWRLAFLAEARGPSGDAESFLGERGLVLFPRLAIERGLSERLRVALEVGYRYRMWPGRFLNLYVGDELALAAGASYELPKTVFERWVAFAELAAATPARSPLNVDSPALRSPLELLGGARAWLGGGLAAKVAVGTGLSGEPGYGRESFRVLASISYERVFRDADLDGVPDEDDRCPGQKEDRDRFEDSDGCPDPDNDGDGVKDEADRCPDQPGLAEHDGCPDRDGDDVPDVADECPDRPGPASSEGCPGAPLAKIEKGKLVLQGAINFDSGKATIKKDSWPVLDEVASLLRGHPEIKKVRVEGHTDNVGGAALNKELSRRRANAVVEYLADKGIARSRLSSEGFGESRPVVPNDAPLNRAKNRRVEFHLSE